MAKLGGELEILEGLEEGTPTKVKIIKKTVEIVSENIMTMTIDGN